MLFTAVLSCEKGEVTDDGVDYVPHGFPPVGVMRVKTLTLDQDGWSQLLLSP